MWLPTFPRLFYSFFQILLSVAIGSITWNPALGGSDDIPPQMAQLLSTHCYDCHSGTEPAAGLGLDHFDSLQSIRRENDVWEKVWRRVADGSMPPVEAGKLPDEERRLLAQWVDEALHKIDCSQGASPGQVTIRRLNRSEYRNSIRDLLGIDYLPAAAFPGDDAGYGFDNIGDVLSLPPVLLEKYLDAAEAIARQVIQTPEDYQPPTQMVDLSAANLDGGINRNSGLTFYSNGTAIVDLAIDQTGSYRIVLEVSGQQAGKEPCRMSVVVNKSKPQTTEIKEHLVRESIVTTARFKPGKHSLAISFDNDFYEPQGPEGNKDRNLLLHRIRVIGPQEFGSQVSVAHRNFFFVYPTKREQEAEAARQLLAVWSSRFFRRPTSGGEVDALLKIYSTVRSEGGSFESGLQVALQAIMVSPKFLYKVERPAPADGSVRVLTNYELATNLSFFIWGTTPDPALLEVATKQNLQDLQVLRSETRRLLASPKAEALIDGFFSQWLQLRALENFSPDPERFPEVDRLLLRDMQRETQLFCWEIVRRNGSVLDLLSADFTFLNARLAQHYGDFSRVATDDNAFVKVVAPRGKRGGILTQGSILSVTSNPTRTSPVRRGRWIMENLLGTPPPPAAPDVMPLESQELSGTLRQRMEQHRSDPNCAACHQMMDPLGFALENFDAVGRWRETDNGHPVDARGELPSGEIFEGVEQLKALLMEQQREAFVRCLTQKMLIYALGRGLRYEDQCTVNEIVKRVQDNNYRLNELIMGIVESVPFRQRQLAQE